MLKKTYKVNINKPAHTVYDKMLGLTDINTYNGWTKIFNETSTIKGNWEKDSKMHFVGTDSSGNVGGMVSIIAENKVNEFVSIKHIGIVKGNEEILSGPDVEKWAGGHENYTFKNVNNQTELVVDIDVVPDYESYFDDNYPKALEKLKEICEG